MEREEILACKAEVRRLLDAQTFEHVTIDVELEGEEGGADSHRGLGGPGKGAAAMDPIHGHLISNHWFGALNVAANRGWPLLLASWVLAVLATTGALFLGEVMGMAPCQLCWFQRIFMFPLAIILGMAAFSDDRRGAVYGIALALAGAAVAAYHSALVTGWVPQWWIPCGAGPSCRDQSLAILGGIQLPWLSLASFVAICVLLAAYLRETRS